MTSNRIILPRTVDDRECHDPRQIMTEFVLNKSDKACHESGQFLIVKKYSMTTKTDRLEKRLEVIATMHSNETKVIIIMFLK